MFARKRTRFLLVSLTFFIASCQAGQNPVTKVPANFQTATQQADYTPETPEPGPTDLSTVSAVWPKCFTSAEGSPIAFMPDSVRILIKEPTGVRVFNLESMEEESFLQAPQGFGPVALSPDGELLAWALEDNTIQLIRIADGKLLHTLEGHTGPVTKLRFSPTGDRLFSASVDTWVRIWDEGGKLLDAFQPTGADNLPNEIQGIGISPDGTMLGSVPFDGPVRVWNLADKKEIVNLRVSGGDVTSDIAFSPDGEFVAADPISQLSLWRTSDWKKIWSGVSSLAFAFSPDSHFLAYHDMDKSKVYLLSLTETEPLRDLEGSQTFIYDLFFSPDGTLLTSAGAGILIWQVETGQLQHEGKATCP